MAESRQHPLIEQPIAQSNAINRTLARADQPAVAGTSRFKSTLVGSSDRRKTQNCRTNCLPTAGDQTQQPAGENTKSA
jgi:hypothetical protein